MNRDSSVASRDEVPLLGLGFNRVTMPLAVARCLEWCRGPRESHTVVTANASHLCLMRRDAEFRTACLSADMVVADGMSVVWAMRAGGDAVPERVAGVDLMNELLRTAGRERLRIYFLGAKKQVVELLARQSEEKFPGLVVAGLRDGYFSSAEHASIVDEIRRAEPHILFIGMPSPFKETWSEQYRDRLCVPVIIGVGGSFDVLTGFVRRAPRLLQSSGLEWLWRLLMEPRKLWKRYLTSNTEFIWLVGRELLSKKRASSKGDAEGR